MTQHLRFGINILQNLPYAELVKRWQQVEALGFDSLWLADHYAWKGMSDSTWFDAWTMLSAMASVTERIRIGTAVTSPVQHNPALLAKRAMTVDHISNGRLELGIGSGGMAAAWEQSLIGETWVEKDRIPRFKEFVEVVDQLLRNPKSTYNGNFYHIEDAPVIPASVQSPRPPLMIAALGAKSLRVAAQYADTWNTYGKAGVPEKENLAAARQQSERLTAYCEAIGRDPQTITRSFYAYTGGHTFAASVDAFYDFVGAYQEAGFTEFILSWHPDEMQSTVGDSAFTSYGMLDRIACEAIPTLMSATIAST